MYSWMKYLALVIAFSGCSTLSFRDAPAPPAVLRGSNSEIREKLLEKIPTGTPRPEAEQTLRSLGLEPQPESDLDSGKPLILCNFTRRQGLSGQNTWLIQLDCPDGKVTDIICEQIGTE